MANTNTYKGIYAMHKYWGKKPFNEISKFIEQYTAPGETVLDSFCGSGVTLIEALKANRTCVGVDLNPLAIKLSKVSMTAVDIDDVNRQFKDITKKLKSTINSLYELEYEDEPTLVTHTIWNSCSSSSIVFRDLFLTNPLTISSTLSFLTPQFTTGNSASTSWRPSNSWVRCSISSSRLLSI